MIYMFLADGFEETEALFTLDLLRRAGISVCTVGLSSTEITGSHNIKVICDKSINEITKTDCTGVILPGGMPGTNNLYADKTVLDYCQYAYENTLPLCAICAAPLILGRLGFLEGLSATCYPGFEHELTGAQVTGEKAQRDKDIITGKSAGSVCEFAREIITYILDRSVADKVLDSIYY